MPAVRTDAVFPDDEAQTVAGALIVASGDATLMRAEPLEPPSQRASESAITE